MRRFYESVFPAFHQVADACGVSVQTLMRVLKEQMGPPLDEGECRMVGDMLCAVRGAGDNWAWALVQKSRAAF